ncbi:DNA polymerase III subunit gamma and tau [Actinoplanes oblitus]|uniref:DNA-directed DNA polymerase n=1 Tax=Actinoplanes oblitus TaxID=3040509 RepID=A0ABY8WEL4_9ACTN|nr:DNA polymerase III subunit gamma and tau [Actinoplanes oblitus]WIM96291.1 DNA polymerase III subunit gamma and tau [Actinoplanes oblitus]
MALALYRKYRPRTFAEVIGQEHVTEPLSQALRSGRLNHAYLFSGPRGCGKTSSARILARSLNCEQGPTPDPCGVCASCKSLANDGAGSIDVIEIDAASHGGVDDARELREKAFFAPASSRYKIYVIDEAHMVSSAGFNALLKLVEEPPDYVKFIFATTEPDKVLGTIRSRTHHYPFRLIPPATLRPYLQQLTEAEGIHVEPAVFPLVVRAGGGSARDTLSVLDQLIAGAGPDGVSYARAVALLGVTDAALLDEMCDALAAGDGAAAYSTIDRVAEAGHDPRRFASDLLERLRDLIVLQQVPDAVAKGLIDGPADQLEAMHAQAGRLGAATLSRCADIVHNGLVEMRGTTAPRLLLELVTARMLLPGADDSTGALLQRLERLERNGPPTPAHAAGPAVAPVADADVREESAPQAAAGLDSPGGAKAAALAVARGANRRNAAGPARPVSPAAAAPAPAAVVPSVAPVSAAPVAEPVSAPPAAAPVSASPVAVPDSAPLAAVPVSEPSSAASDLASLPAAVAAAAAVPGAAVPGSPTAGSASAGPGSASAGSGSDAAAPEEDWNQIADGGYDDAPPWDEEPPADPEPVAPPIAFPQVLTVWQAFGPKNSTIQRMQDSGIGLRDVEGDTVFFVAPNARYADRFLEFTDLIATEFADALGGRWQIRCDVGDASAASSRNAAPRGPAQAPDRDQSAARRMPAGRPAASTTAPERNTGRTESRPSRPQRAPAADAEDDGPAAAAPPAAEQPAGFGPQAVSGSQVAGQAGRSMPSIAEQAVRSAPSAGGQAVVSGPSVDGETARPGPSMAGEHAGPVPSVGHGSGHAGAPMSSGGDTDWPEPVRPGTAARRPAPPADDDWPEPAKPGSRAVPAKKPVAPSVAAVDPATGRPPAGGSEAVTTVSGDASGHLPSAHTEYRTAPDSTTAPAPTASAGSPVGADRSTDSAAADANHAAVSAASADRSARFAEAVADRSVASAPADADRSVVPAASGVDRSSVSAATGADRSVAPTAPAAFPAAAAGAAAASAQAASPPVRAEPARSNVPARSAAMELARAAAARGGKAGAGLNARAAAPHRPAGSPDQGSSGGVFSDGTPIGEAPYDPEYDGPPPSGGNPGYEGFDPGDEPLDEVIDEKTARQSSEEQAFQLLRDAFGAEKIGEM